MNDDRVQRVKQANDIVDVVGDYVPLTPKGNTFKGLCPFHEDHRPSFDVDPRRQRYRCWSCGKHGDVISFVQEHDRVGFTEALELLAHRAGILLEKMSSPAHNENRALMLDVCRWSAQQYHSCLLDLPEAESARVYLGERGFLGETIRDYSIGYAPASGNWLLERAQRAKLPLEILEKVGLIARRSAGPGYYDRFRDRVQFPIRDIRGQVVGFGGRILPNSPLADRVAKYYNSSDTPLFNKKELLYGLDKARHASTKSGYLAVVEGYTDVLMAHQLGILEVVATMGTALNARHVHHLRRVASKIILLFDADQGGQSGADRALNLFASHEVELAIATLPDGLDPYDLLRTRGPEAFRQILENSVPALEFKLQSVLKEQDGSIEAQRRAVDAVLSVIALAPALPGQAGAMKTELMVTRIAQRFALQEETVRARLRELRTRRPRNDNGRGQPEAPRQAPAAPEERELLEILLADDSLLERVRSDITLEMIVHPGLRTLLSGLYSLQERGEPPTLDRLRPQLENVRLVEKALEMQDIGQRHPDRTTWLESVLDCFRSRKQKDLRQQLQRQLLAAQTTGDEKTALELLRKLQNLPSDSP